MPVPGTTFYTADNANIHYVGRLDSSNPQAPRFSAPGFSIQARFRGTSIAVLLEDEFRYGLNHNFFDVLIDDVLVMKLGLEKSITKYEVASNLPDGEHSITIVKRTEANVGYCSFLGFEIVGELLAFAKPTRRMIFIGDSISCGSGNEAENESAQCSEEGWGQPYCNARMAFGPIVARQFNADAHVVAVGGIGMVRNYSFQYDTRTLPEVYDLIFVEETGSPIWDKDLFIPDAIVIALGTNDFSVGESERPLLSQDVFVSAYIAFLQKLRGYYPNASFFCISSSMLGDCWPTEAEHFATDQLQSIAKVVDHFNQSGDTKVHKFYVSKFRGTGCGEHPSASQHELLARELQPVIANALGW